MGKRIITKRQERALRLCHQDFDGLTQPEAAYRMNISQQALSQLLARCEEIAPQFFPILTKQEAKFYHLFTVEGWSVEDIAKNENEDGITEYSGVTLNAVYKTFQRCREKGLKFPGGRGKVLQLRLDKVEDKIKHKF